MLSLTLSDMTSLLSYTAGRVSRTAALSLLLSLPLLAAAQTQTAPTAPTVSAPVPAITAPTTIPAAVRTTPAAPTQPAAAPAGPAAPVAAPAAASRPVLSLPDLALSRLAIELSGAMGGRLYRCPPSLRLPQQAICLYARGQSADLQARIVALLGDRVAGQWQTSGPLLNLLVRPSSTAAGQASANQYVALLDLGEGDHLMILNTQAAQVAAADAATPVTPAQAELYLTPTDLLGLVTVQRLDDRNYRLTAQGRVGASVALGARELVQDGVITTLPSPLRLEGGQLYVPLSLLRAVGCVLSPGESSEMVTVSCGSRSAGVTLRRL